MADVPAPTPTTTPAADPDANYWAQFEHPAPKGAPPANGPLPPVDEAHKDAIDLGRVISPKEAKIRQTTGKTSTGETAPKVAMVDTQATDTTEDPDDSKYWDQFGKPEPPPTKPVIAKPVTKGIGDRLLSLGGGVLEQSNKALKLLEIAGSTLPMAIDYLGRTPQEGQEGEMPSPVADTSAQDLWFKNTVDRAIENDSTFALGPDADRVDRGLHGIGSALMFLDQMVASGGRTAALESAFARSLAERLGVAAATATAPSMAEAVDRGRQVLAVTGDPKAATASAVTAFTMSEAMSMIPGGGKTIPVKAALGAASFGVGGEVSRQAQNAALLGGDETDRAKRSMSDEDLRTENAKMTLREPFSAEGVVDNLVQGAVFGGVHGVVENLTARRERAGMPHQAVEQPQNIMEHAQIVAAAEAKTNGGDMLDQTLAASHANAVLSAHHDAAAYEAHMETQHQRVTEENAQADAAAEQFAREAALNQAAKEKAPATTPEAGFEAQAKTLQERKDADFAKAQNQKGDQEIARGETLAVGAEKGGAKEPGPTLADADTAEVFKTLKERRAAEGEPEKTTAERLKEQNPEDNFTPYVEPKGSPKETKTEDNGPEPDERPAEGDSWKAPTGATVEVLKDHGNGEYTIRTTPADTAQVPRRRRVSEAALDLMRSTAEPAEAPQNLSERRATEATEAATPEPVAEPAPTAAEVDTAAHEAATSPKNDLPIPTEAQQNAGNHQMGHIEVQGLPITVEHPEGATRPNGIEQPAHYGYIKGTMGADNMHVDVLVGKHPDNSTHFVVDHMNDQGFEQHKVLTGFANRLEALRAYRKAFPNNPMGPVSEVKTPELKEWLKNGDTTKPFDQKGVNRLGDTRFADTTANNASGESSASLEAQRRAQEEKATGKTRHLIDPDGNATPVMHGVDAVDRKAPPGHIIVQADGKGGHAILDRGGLPAMHANGLLARAKARGSLDAEPARARDKFEAPHGRDATEADRRVGPRMTQDEATAAIKPLTDRIGSEGLQVHADTTTLPDSVKADMVTYNHPNPRAVYDPTTDTVHIVAGAHRSNDEILRTAVHEIVGHQGVRKLFDSVPEFKKAMQDIYDNISDRAGAIASPLRGVNKATAKQWMKDYMSQHALDARNPRHQQLAVDEYIAHLAEHDVNDPTQQNPSLLRRAIDAVRSGLRKLGAVREWTDADIRALIRKSNANLASENATIRASAQEKGNGTRFADEENPSAERYPADHPLAVVHKFGKTMEDQANYNPGFVRKRADWMKDKWGDTQDSRLAFIGLRNLKDFMGIGKLPSLHQFIRVHDQMDGRRGQLMNRAADIAKDWSRWISKNKKMGGDLGELMHASTLGGVDPSKAFEYRYTNTARGLDATKAAHDEMRADLHARLKKVFNSLDDKGRELFNTVRDSYQQHRQEVFDALQARIEQSGADANTKKAIMSELRQKFEAGKVQGPYFPLARFGDHWASAKDADGNTVSFSRFESKAQKKAWLDNAKSLGYDVDGGQRMDDKSMMERIDPRFVQKVTELVKGIDPSLADEVWQEYLKAMPEMSMRKQFIHRIGRLGYSMDAMRAFAHNSFHGSHQLARLEYGNRLDGLVQSTKDQAQAINSTDPSSKDAEWSSSLARELSRRYDWIKNPRSSPLASAITKFGFGWYLGAAPATAFRIFSQNPMLAAPMLAKFHGPIGATRELSKASAQWAMSKGSLGDTLRGNERRAFDTAADMGVFSNTNTQALASGGSSGDPMFTGAYYHIQQAAGYLFNAMEHHNRMTTYLAAYRLGVKSGMGHDDAVNHANDLTWDSHFDYTNANRPRVLQNDFAKVALLFKQYSWGVTYRLAREFRDTVNSQLPAQQRAASAFAFGGLLGRGMLFAGVTGLPLYWIAESVVNAVMGDKDRPYDMTAAVHKHLADSMGQTAADAVMTGPVGAISGASLSGGASYNDLWYRPPSRDETAPEQWSDMTGKFLGAIPAIGTNMATGAMMMHDGQIERGFEHFVSPEAAAILKAIRYSREGVTNLKGEQILTRDQLNAKDIFTQAIGFTPQKVADAYAQNTAIKNVAKAITDRREHIINHLAVASSMGDSDEISKGLAEASAFDERNPGLPIKGETIVNAGRNLLREQAEAVNGVKLPPGLQDLYSQYGAQPKEGTQ